MTEQTPSLPVPGTAPLRAPRRVPRPSAIGALALVGAGLLQTWTGTERLGQLSRPYSFVGHHGQDQVAFFAAQALLGLLACAAGLSAGTGRRWGLPAGLGIAALGCGFALAGRAVG